LHAVVVPAAQVLARHAGRSCRAVVARAAATAARPAPGDRAANGLAEAAPAAELFGLLLRVGDATAAPAALCISNECHEMSFLGCGSIGVRVGDAATPGPAGVKVSLCYHVCLLCILGVGHASHDRPSSDADNADTYSSPSTSCRTR